MRQHQQPKRFRRDQYQPESYGKRQPRKPLRKQGTRKGAVQAAKREAGIR